MPSCVTRDRRRVRACAWSSVSSHHCKKEARGEKKKSFASLRGKIDGGRRLRESARNRTGRSGTRKGGHLTSAPCIRFSRGRRSLFRFRLGCWHDCPNSLCSSAFSFGSKRQKELNLDPSGSKHFCEHGKHKALLKPHLHHAKPSTRGGPLPFPVLKEAPNQFWEMPKSNHTQNALANLTTPANYTTATNTHLPRDRVSADQAPRR